jgi:hypothetical protein
MTRNFSSLIACLLLVAACSSMVPMPKGQDEEQGTGKVEAKARVMLASPRSGTR